MVLNPEMKQLVHDDKVLKVIVLIGQVDRE